MADNAAHAEHGDDHHAHVHEPSHYIRIWGILLVLLVVSFVGPWLGIQIITLITAFGIAVVKAYLVMKEFMHLDVEKPIVHYFLVTSVVFMVLMFAGISPDVMNHEGTNWVNVAAEAEIERALAQQAEGGDHHGGDHHEDDHGADGH